MGNPAIKETPRLSLEAGTEGNELLNKLKNIVKRNINANIIKTFITADYILFVAMKPIMFYDFDTFEEINRIIPIKLVSSGFNHYKNYIVLCFSGKGIKREYKEVEIATKDYYDDVNVSEFDKTQNGKRNLESSSRLSGLSNIKFGTS